MKSVHGVRIDLKTQIKWTCGNNALSDVASRREASHIVLRDEIITQTKPHPWDCPRHLLPYEGPFSLRLFGDPCRVDTIR